MIALGLEIARSPYVAEIAVQTHVPSVTVSPAELGQAGSELADVPAVVQRKNRPVPSSLLERRTLPTEKEVLAAQTAIAITVQRLDERLPELWRGLQKEST